MITYGAEDYEVRRAARADAHNKYDNNNNNYYIINMLLTLIM